MKLVSTILPLVALTAAIVLPDKQVMEQIAIETQPQSYLDNLKSSLQEAWSGVQVTLKGSIASGENALDNHKVFWK